VIEEENSIETLIKSIDIGSFVGLTYSEEGCSECKYVEGRLRRQFLDYGFIQLLVPDPTYENGRVYNFHISESNSGAYIQNIVVLKEMLKKHHESKPLF